MKISIFSTFYPYRGGIAQFSSLLFRSLEKKSTIKAITFKRQYPNFLFPGKTQLVTKEDKVDKINAKRTLDSINPITYYKTAREINKQKPDLYVSNYWMTFFGPALGIISRLLNKKIKQIAVLHNVTPHEKKFFDKPFTKYFLKKTDGFIVMSDNVLKDLLHLKPEAKFIRIGHPVYHHFGEKIEQEKAIKKLKLDPTKKTLLFFGFIREYKGLDLLLKAFELLDNDYQLLIGGEIYGDFSKYQELIDTSRKKEDIHLFTDYISDSEVPYFFSASDVCILPYKSATQSGITAISNHFCLPIIATDVGGLKETIQDKATGLIVKKVNEKDISIAIKNYFQEGYKNQFSQKIADQNKINSWDNFAEKLLHFASSIK
jgi:glycosyltransferase involved in cell wall biosynthesis